MKLEPEMLPPEKPVKRLFAPDNIGSADSHTLNQQNDVNIFLAKTCKNCLYIYILSLEPIPEHSILGEACPKATLLHGYSQAPATLTTELLAHRVPACVSFAKLTIYIMYISVPICIIMYISV